MSSITAIALNLPMATEHYKVGDTDFVHGAFSEITEIRDVSNEYEDHTDWIYDIYADGKLYKSIVNSPVSITYSLEESK